MNIGRTIFSQLTEFLPLSEFRRCVERYDGNRRTRSFSCWDQFLCMAFGQLTSRESLRDTVTCLRALSAQLYHAGIRGRVSRSTLADANESRDWRIYADFAAVMIARARALYRDLPPRKSSAPNPGRRYSRPARKQRSQSGAALQSQSDLRSAPA